MSFRKSLDMPQWNVKLPSQKCTSSPLDSNASQPENSIESLLIEDLDLSDLNASPQSAKTCNRSTEEVSFDEYSEPESNNFFGEQVPAVVSETYLMNELYILVKVPTNSRSYIPTSEKACQTLTQSCGGSPDVSENISEKIQEMEQQEEECSAPVPRSKIPIRTQSSSKIPCWVRENGVSEEFPSKTHIFRYNNGVTCHLPNQVPEQIEELPLEMPTQSNRTTTPPHSCHDEIELQEVNFEATPNKRRVNVSLDNYGILITPTKTPKNDKLLVFQVDTEQKPKKPKSVRASCFEWFTKCFSRKRRRTDFMHAVVYKTYFVKWKKCTELNDCPRCQRRAATSLRRNST